MFATSSVKAEILFCLTSAEIFLRVDFGVEVSCNVENLLERDLPLTKL